MKINLLHDGGFEELSSLTFPVEVEGEDWCGLGFDVHETEFDKHGLKLRNSSPEQTFYFSLQCEECEVVE